VLTKPNRKQQEKMKIALLRILALAGAFAAATENLESPHVRRRALEESDADTRVTTVDPPGKRDLARLRRKKPGRKPPAAIQSMEGNEYDMDPPGRMIALAGELNDTDSGTTEDGPPGGRNLAKLRKKKPGRKPPAAIQSREGSEYDMDPPEGMIEVVGDDEDSEATEDGRPPGWRE
jgi:hypothetical protein